MGIDLLPHVFAIEIQSRIRKVQIPYQWLSNQNLKHTKTYNIMCISRCVCICSKWPRLLMFVCTVLYMLLVTSCPNVYVCVCVLQVTLWTAAPAPCPTHFWWRVLGASWSPTLPSSPTPCSALHPHSSLATHQSSGMFQCWLYWKLLSWFDRLSESVI